MPYTNSLKEVEAELDLINPYWDSVTSRRKEDGTPELNVRGRPFFNMKSPKIDRLKWLLVRRKQIIQGDVDNGILIVKQRGSSSILAVPVIGSQPEPPPKWEA